MQQGESSSDDMYEEVEELVRTICGQNFGHKVNKLRSYRRKFKKRKDQYQTAMKLVHHWKDKCLDTKAQHIYIYLPALIQPTKEPANQSTNQPTNQSILQQPPRLLSMDAECEMLHLF